MPLNKIGQEINFGTGSPNWLEPKSKLKLTVGQTCVYKALYRASEISYSQLLTLTTFTAANWSPYK